MSGMQKVHVELGERSYDVCIGRDCFRAALEGLDFKAGIALVTDSNVAVQPWFASMADYLKGLTSLFSCYQVEAGESSKSLSQFSALCSRMAADRFTRKSTVIAVGGGVIGDLSGYLAASYLRGVGFVQIPTTLLAAVDSSVGGKTGVNLPEGKNLVGAFYQPSRVIVDMTFMDTLPEREWSAGMAEVIKYGLIRDMSFFGQVAGGRPSATDELASMIRRCVEIKAEVVAGDEKEESGLRAILNFGHTIGHAIEQASGYGDVLHGEAVAIGMVAATWISHRHLDLDESLIGKVESALLANGLPCGKAGISLDQLKPAMARDKKATQSGIKWVLLPEGGQTRICGDVPEELVAGAIDYCAAKA